MKRFLIECCMFDMLILALLIPPCIFLMKTKENFKDIDKIIEDSDDYLIGYAYNENNYKYLKWKTIDVKSRNTLIALGSSRVLQFRDKMFNTVFYNAGYSVSKISEFKLFLESIEECKYPKYLIIGLDQWMFNSNWDDMNTPKNNLEDKWKDAFQLTPNILIVFQVWRDILKGKYRGIDIKKDNAKIKVGLNAMVNNKGFRNDGSFSYGKQIAKLINNEGQAEDLKFVETLDHIKDGTGRFIFTNTINPLAFKELENLLSYCQENRIYLIAFIPPFADKVNAALNANNGSSYMANIYKDAKVYFEKYNFELYDYSYLKYFNSNDKEMIDGFHGGEIAYLKILISILNSGSILNTVASIDELKKELKIKKNDYEMSE